MKSPPRSKAQHPSVPYLGSKWEKAIKSLESPNFWKFGVADLLFLDYVGKKEFVLDVGCGTGGSTLLLASKGKAEWTIGVDLLRDMISVARKKAVQRSLDDKVCFLVCDGRRLPFKSSFFDGLISRGDAFCFLVPLRTAVEEFRRVMRSGGVVAVEMDNRMDWKPGSIISTGFMRTNEAQIAYVITTFTKKRNYNSVSYILDPNGRTAKGVARDVEFQKKGFKSSRCLLQKIKKETVKVKRSAPTHWPTKRELIRLFSNGGFKAAQVTGNGLFMNLFASGEPAIVKALKKNPQTFFEIERRLVRYVNPEAAPTMILRAVAP